MASGSPLFGGTDAPHSPDSAVLADLVFAPMDSFDGTLRPPSDIVSSSQSSGSRAASPFVSNPPSPEWPSSNADPLSAVESCSGDPSNTRPLTGDALSLAAASSLTASASAIGPSAAGPSAAGPPSASAPWRLFEFCPNRSSSHDDLYSAYGAYLVAYPHPAAKVSSMFPAFLSPANNLSLPNLGKYP